MANKKIPFYSTVVIFVIVLYIFCQFVVSIPISVKSPRIIIQSYSNEVTIKISTENQIYEEVTSDDYKTTTEFPTYNAYEAYEVTDEFSIYNPLSSVYDAIADFIIDTYNALVKFIRNHVGLTIGIIVGIVVLVIGPYLVTVLIRLIGFGIGGIAKGSYAAIIMASHGGKVAVNSACAILQSAGALGVNGFMGLIKLFLNLIRWMFTFIL